MKTRKFVEAFVNCVNNCNELFNEAYVNNANDKLSDSAYNYLKAIDSNLSQFHDEYMNETLDDRTLLRSIFELNVELKGATQIAKSDENYEDMKYRTYNSVSDVLNECYTDMDAAYFE